MQKNLSPWIEQLKRTHIPNPLNQEKKTDVVIVDGKGSQTSKISTTDKFYLFNNVFIYKFSNVEGQLIIEKTSYADNNS